MRYIEIIGETDTWEIRHANHQRQQSRRTRLRTKLAAADSKAADQARSAASARARSGDKVRSLKHQLAQPKL